MQGQIIKTFPAKGFGFIKPNDGSGDVFYSHKYCQGSDILAVGDKVEFDIDPTKKGKNRSAASVKLNQSGTASNLPPVNPKSAKGSTTSTSATATTTRPLEDLDVHVPMDPDQNGVFPVQVRTYKKGKLQKRSFRMHSNYPFTVMWTEFDDEGNPSLKANTCDSFSFETTKGLAELRIVFPFQQLTIEFTLDNGHSVRKTLVK